MIRRRIDAPLDRRHRGAGEASGKVHGVWAILCSLETIFDAVAVSGWIVVIDQFQVRYAACLRMNRNLVESTYLVDKPLAFDPKIGLSHKDQFIQFAQGQIVSAFEVANLVELVNVVEEVPYRFD